MKAVEVFDTCYARYRGLREWLKDSSDSVSRRQSRHAILRISVASGPRARLRIHR